MKRLLAVFLGVIPFFNLFCYGDGCYQYTGGSPGCMGPAGSTFCLARPQGMGEGGVCGSVIYTYTSPPFDGVMEIEQGNGYAAEYTTVHVCSVEFDCVVMRDLESGLLVCRVDPTTPSNPESVTQIALNINFSCAVGSTD